MKVTTDNTVFENGYFIEKSPNSVATNFSSPEREFVFTSSDDKSLLYSVSDLIRNARSSIKLCAFILSYEPIVLLLEEILRSGNVAVFILTSVKGQELTSNMLSEEETDNKERNRHLEHIARLASGGAHIRASGMAHAKFVVTDRNKALVMTANLTEPSLSTNKNNLPPNPESGILIETASEVGNLDALFDAVYLYGTEFREFELQDGKHQYIRQVTTDLTKSDLPIKQSRLTWTAASHDKHLLNDIINLIAQAQSEVLISTFSIRELQQLTNLSQTIKEAIQRGVSIHIFCRAMNYREDHLEACLELFNMGCRISGDSFNHAKGILVDNQKGILFTANIDGIHGLLSGFEVGVLLSEEDKGFIGFKSFMQYQKQHAPFEFKKSVPKSALAQFYKEYYRQRDIRLPYFPQKIELVVRSNAQYYQELIAAIATQPIYYNIRRQKDDKPERIIFEIGGRYYELETLNAIKYTVKNMVDKKNVPRERFFLPYTEIQISTYES